VRTVDRRDERTAGEHVEKAEDRALLLLEEPRQGRRVDARHRNEAADAVDDQRTSRNNTRDATPVEARAGVTKTVAAAFATLR
jgi:hypothetical protein